MAKAESAMRTVVEPHAALGGATTAVPRAAGPVHLAGSQAVATTGRTVTRLDLAEAVYRQVGLSRKESAGLVEMVLAEITEKLALGETVKLSSFGSFVVRDKGERIGRNPKTGVEVPIMQRRVIVFKPSNVLKARMNGDIVPDDEL